MIETSDFPAEAPKSYALANERFSKLVVNISCCRIWRRRRGRRAFSRESALRFQHQGSSIKTLKRFFVLFLCRQCSAETKALTHHYSLRFVLAIMPAVAEPNW
jgi:hypothetical protein